jgi:decaprenylphospho-beta-D-ribofuranose 2-oxidase
MSKVHGWGRNIWGPLNLSEDPGQRGYLPVGARRSYGDSSLNSGGLTVETSNLKTLVVNESGLATCGAGVTIGDLERAALNKGYFPKVVPGTEFVSIGGAFASDIHGKSHHSYGSFSRAVSEITIRLASNEVRRFQQNSAEFWASAGGMGLTGVVEEIQLQLNKVETSYVMVRSKRVANLDEMLESLRALDVDHPFTVAWIDLSGDFRGRGIVSGGRHATLNELNAKQKKNPFQYSDVNRFRVPDVFPSQTINSTSVRIFNEFWFNRVLRDGAVEVRKFMHPLDGIGSWNRVYGKNGFLQYQFVVPFDQIGFIQLVMKEIKRLGTGSFLGVLKTFGEESLGHLSFPMPGWTLTVDIPAGIEGLEKVLNKLDLKLLEAGGRIYLTKDSRMSSDHIKLMYPRVDEWRSIRNRMDPTNHWQSDQSRRLRLCKMD